MKYSDQELLDINQVYIDITKDTTLPLKRGMILRQIMWDAINHGETPTDYRYLWIKTAALDVIKHIGDLAGEFDDIHLDDRASVEDLRDILNQALKLLDKR